MATLYSAPQTQVQLPQLGRESDRQRGIAALHVTVRHFVIFAYSGCVPIIVFCVQLHGALAYQALCVALLLAGASALAGGLLGFLFGIPRTMQQGEEVALRGDVVPTAQALEGRDERATQMLAVPVYRANTNLEQISDWLTKILVGVGLTQVNAIRRTGAEIVASVSAAFGPSTGAQPLAATILVYFIIVGFLAGYLWTRLFLASELRRADQGAVRELKVELQQTRKEVAILQEVSPVALNVTTESPAAPSVRRSSIARPIVRPDDPQKGRWGGKREDNCRVVRAGKIRPLRSDPSNFRIPLEVVSTDPVAHPLLGIVRFHLHHTFQQDIEEVATQNGVARLEVVAYGAFTVGVEIDDGTALEIDLADSDIDAPPSFKER